MKNQKMKPNQKWKKKLTHDSNKRISLEHQSPKHLQSENWNAER